MARQELAGEPRNKLRREGDSFVYTIPKDLARELGLESEDRPDRVEWDPERREIALAFE